jgi:very-short-patch-repair endonuclease
MKNFAKSILNYFATFNETRFRFSRKLPYEWSDDSFTCDLSVFPKFQKELISSIVLGKPLHIEIRKGEHIVSLDSTEVKEALLSTVESKFNVNFLQNCIDQFRERLLDISPDEENAKLDKQAFREGVREFNLAFRHQALQAFSELQDKRIKGLQAELGFSSVPLSSFNPQREVQHIFDDLQKLASGHNDSEAYLTAVITYITDQSYNFVIFDLHPVLRRYNQLLGVQSLYLFFHEIAKDTQKYPLFTLEMELHDSEHSIVLQSIRNVIMLNTPAINNFEFDTVLTTPRACRFEDTATELSVIERFLQAKYNVNESFIQLPHFRPLIRDDLPAVCYRVGFQAVKEEDRRILDYSELITSLEKGAGHKFIDLISRYVDGNVKSTADEVQNTYIRNYPRKSTERLIPSRLTVPLSLNETQKKILEAVENEKSEIIVVDGPPGTGKSYTITAIVYLANQLGKSVVVTSHKKQALDVIDQVLTDRFKMLHPRAKPSILRLERQRGPASLNNIENTLSAPVINAARTRLHEVNQDAVSNDRKRLYAEIDGINTHYWENTNEYTAAVQKAFECAQEIEAIFENDPDSNLIPPKLPKDVSINVDRVKKLADRLGNYTLTISLEALAALFQDRNQLPDVLTKCDELNRLHATLPPEAVATITAVPPEPEPFEKVINQISQYFEEGIPIRNLSMDSVDFSQPDVFDENFSMPYRSFSDLKDRVCRLVELESKFFGKILKNREITNARQALNFDYPWVSDYIEKEGARSLLEKIEIITKYIKETHDQYSFLTLDYISDGFRKCSPSDLKDLLAQIGSLGFNTLVKMITTLAGKPLSEMTLSEIKEKLQLLDTLKQYLELKAAVRNFANHVSVSVDDLPMLYATLKKVQDVINSMDYEDIKSVKALFRYYEPLLEKMNVDASDVSSLAGITTDTEKADHFFQFIQLHADLSRYPLITPPTRAMLDDYFKKSQKLLEGETDKRLSNLINHTADVQRIQTAIAAGKRITPEQAQVLLKNLSCIISDPGLISQHFPMEADMIDLLVIDEASQVSIAESISLMLRGKQTIVFGDELQYGAVGAVNVSQRYSTFYFKDILRDYALDRDQVISEEEKERIAREVSETPAEDEEESSRLFPVNPATREWLKTFSIRTSTLAFAKALRNYSESLNVHFRSFPEIISYSNEYFYKESQIELIPNRIRTKPITEVLRFIKVETKGLSGRNVNLDEIDAIQEDLKQIIQNGYKGTIGVVCSFREQAVRMEEIFRKELSIHPDLERNHRFKIWFVGDVQGEERDMIYYSFVQDKKIDNAELRTIYPIIGGTADNIRRLKMQRLNVGFSRSKDVMVFVHSMPLGDYTDTRLGNALLHYEKILNSAHDHHVEDESVFGSPAEKALYGLILQTPFFKQNQDKLRLVAQFEIGKYIREEFHRNIPKYRVDFLLTQSDAGKEKSLIIEYDGVEFHTKNPDVVTKHNFDQEYLEYDAQRQLELESYGYSFLRINKFSLIPDHHGRTPVDVLNDLLENNFV